MDESPLHDRVPSTTLDEEWEAPTSNQGHALLDKAQSTKPIDARIDPLPDRQGLY